MLAQPYLQGVAAGNKRIYLLDGVAVGAALRHPVAGDFRIVSPDGAGRAHRPRPGDRRTGSRPTLRATACGASASTSSATT